MPWLLHYMRIEVFHSTNYMIPLRAFPRHTQGPVKCVVTIHDLIPLIYPQHTPRAMKTRLYPLFKWLMRQVGARADVIITPSSASRADVIKYMHIPAQQHEKVLAIPEGVDARYVPAKKKPADHRTVLYVGRLDPYKNVVNLIEAFSLVHAQLPNVRLQIVGPDDPRYPEARRRSAERGLDPWIDRTGYADAATLLEAYQQADVLALPSRYEGFGLPVLEAMACGTPVVCSRTASLPEVAGDAACLIDPDDVQGLADALIQTLSDPEYADRLKKRGLQRAQHFTWESTARKTLAAYTA
jgi:glycosyltransferase involved in cell wall biosynthesis